MLKFIKNTEFRNGYRLALLGIFIFVLIAVFNMVYMLSNHTKYAKLINISGKQRMLSQQITLFVSMIKSDPNQDIKKHMDSAIAQMRYNHNTIISSDISEDIKSLYLNPPLNIDKLLNEFLTLAETSAQTKEDIHIEKLFVMRKNILDSLDKAVSKIEKESEEFSELMIIIELSIFILITLLLYLESRYIFEPMLNRISKEKKQNKKLQKKLENLVRSRTKKLEESLEIINHYVYTSKTDKKGLITYASNAFCELCGYSEEELLGKTHSIIKHPDNPDEYFIDLWETLSGGKPFNGIVKNKKKDGTAFWLDTYILPEYDEKGELIGYTAYRKDITHEKSLEEMNVKLEKLVEEKTRELTIRNEQLKKLSETDDLTGIYNRTRLKEYLSLELKKASRYESTFSIVLLDLDHFKKVNDTYGHLKGDYVLKEVANLVSSLIRSVDLFARWGGEEFVIVVFHQDKQSATVLAQKIREKIYSSDFDGLKISASFGVTEYIPGDTEENIFERADEAMYKAKESGRNRVVTV